MGRQAMNSSSDAFDLVRDGGVLDDAAELAGARAKLGADRDAWEYLISIKTVGRGWQHFFRNRRDGWKELSVPASPGWPR
jgi:hypothetical protein